MEEHSPLQQTLARWDSFQSTAAEEYVPGGYDHSQERWIQQMLLMDNAPVRWNKRHCTNCKKDKRQTNLHMLFQCQESQRLQKRRIIFNSICTELDHLTKGHEQNEIYDEEQFKLAYYIAKIGYIKIPKTNWENQGRGKY